MGFPRPCTGDRCYTTGGMGCFFLLGSQSHLKNNLIVKSVYRLNTFAKIQNVLICRENGEGIVDYDSINVRTYAKAIVKYHL